MKRQKDINLLVEEFPNYFQAPKFLFHYDLSKHSLLVIFYLINCSNRKNGGKCFPSIDDICLKCSIPSPTTVRNGIDELIKKGLIIKHRIGRKNIYEVCEHIYAAIDIANGKDIDLNDLKETSPYSDGINNENTENTNIESFRDSKSSVNDQSSIHSDDQSNHYMTTNKNNLTRLNNNINKEVRNNSETCTPEENSSRKNESTIENFSLLSKANEFYYSLSKKEKRVFDKAAKKLIPIGTDNDVGEIIQLRNARLRFYRLLKQEPIRFDGYEHYNVQSD